MFSDKKHIVDRLKEGDVKAFETLYKNSYVYLCSVAIKYIYDFKVACEIVDDIFINVWNNRQTMSYAIMGYLIKAVQNRCLNHIRQKRLQENVISEVEHELFLFRERLINDEPYPLARLEDQEIQKRIRKAVNTLPGKCRHIFIQHFYQQKSYEEIAESNQIAPSTVRGQIKIAIAKLKPLLEDLH